VALINVKHLAGALINYGPNYGYLHVLTTYHLEMAWRTVLLSTKNAMAAMRSIVIHPNMGIQKQWVILNTYENFGLMMAIHIYILYIYIYYHPSFDHHSDMRYNKVKKLWY